MDDNPAYMITHVKVKDEAIRCCEPVHDYDEAALYHVPRFLQPPFCACIGLSSAAPPWLFVRYL